MLRKAAVLIVIASVICAGCAHTTANPVPLAQAGDDTKSCDGIANEMQQMLQAKTLAEADRNKQIASNVALGVAGAFLIVPLFFMDTGNAATVEEKAAQARYQRLSQMQIDKKCLAPSQAASATASGTALPSVSPGPTETTAPKAALATQPQQVEPALTATQKLEALDSMLKKGLITQEEYTAKKQEILKAM